MPSITVMHVLNMALKAAAPMIGALQSPMAWAYRETMPEAKAALPSGKVDSVRWSRRVPKIRNPRASTTEMA